MRNAEVIRQWKTPRHRKGYLFGEARRRYGVTERTIRRDVEAFQEAGFRLRRPRRRKSWRLVEATSRSRSGFTLPSSRRSLQPPCCRLGGAPFGQDSSRPSQDPRGAAAEEPAVPEPDPGPVLRAPDPWKDYSKKQDVIAALTRSCTSARRDRLLLFNSRRTKSYGSTPTASSTTAAGSEFARAPRVRRGAHLRGRARRWRSRRRFEIPADFSPPTVRPAFGIIGQAADGRALFAAETVAVRERNWHESQTPPRSRTARCGSR